MLQLEKLKTSYVLNMKTTMHRFSVKAKKPLKRRIDGLDY